MGEYLFIASAIFSIVNGTVLLCVNPRRIINRVFFGSAVAMALWFLCVGLAARAGQQTPFDSRPVVFWIRSSSVVAAFSIWSIWLLKSVLLEDRISAQTIVKRSWPWLTISLALAALAYSESFIASTSRPEEKGRGIGYLIFALAIIFCCSSLLADALRQLPKLSGIRRIEMQFFVIGTTCACLLAVTTGALGLVFDATWLRHSSSIWFSMLHGITVWAVCSHRIFDAKQIILSIGQRLTLLIFVGFAALSAHQILNQFVAPFWSVLCTATVACAAGIALDSQTRRWIGLDTRLRLAGPRRQIIDWAREISDEHKLQENFSQLFRDQCQTSSVLFSSSNAADHDDSKLAIAADWPGFIVLCKDGWITPEALQRSRAAAGTQECDELMRNKKLGALLAVPKGSRPPSLVIGLGQKESLRPYTFPDIQILLELAELMDNILTHSRVATHAAHIERMNSATMMSRGLAHDLNSLATPVATFLIYMESKITPATTQAIVLNDAKASLRVMQNYIQESLFFSRELVPKLTTIDAHSLLNDVVRLSLQRASYIDAKVGILSGPNFGFVADLALLRRLMQNLVFNGIDASVNCGAVEISASVIDGQQVCLQVADHGSGIPTAIRSRIFEPYYTTKVSGGDRRGLGLGLAICQKIAELHGGRISVSANSPCGTVFTTTFPRKNAGPAMLPLNTEQEATFRDPRLITSIPKFGPT